MFSSLIIEYLRGVLGCNTDGNRKVFSQDNVQFKMAHAPGTTATLAQLKETEEKEEAVGAVAGTGTGTGAATSSAHLCARGRETMKVALERLRRAGPWTLEGRSPAAAAAAAATADYTSHDDADGDVKAVVESYRKPGYSGKIFRLSVTLPGCTPARVWSMLRADCARASWLLAEARTLQVLDKDLSGSTDVQQQVSNSKLGGLVAAREFVLVRRMSALPGGAFAMAFASAEHPSATLSSRRVLRASCGPSGWLLEPSPDGEGTRMRWVSDCSFGGWLPTPVYDAGVAAYMLAYVAHLHARCRQHATPV